MKTFKNRIREIQPEEPIFFLPPFKAQSVFLTLSETIDWGLSGLNIPDFWKYTKGAGVKVAVLDTGIASHHIDLKEAIILSRDFTGSSTGVSDTNGHGTHVAGIIGARQNNGGVIGVAPECKLLIGKVLNNSGGGSLDSVVKGIEWAIENGADIINMSFGSPGVYFPSIRTAIDKALKKNIFVICAAGNGGMNREQISFPANYDPVISVGAINEKWEIAKFSSKGKHLDIVAPGDGITSTYPLNTYMKLSGTSMAAPFVSGLAALALAKHRNYGGGTKLNTQHQLFQHLIKTAIDLDERGWDEASGYGLINPKKILMTIRKKK